MVITTTNGTRATRHKINDLHLNIIIAQAVKAFQEQPAWRWEAITRLLGPGTSKALAALIKAGFISKQRDGWYMRVDTDHLKTRIAKLKTAYNRQQWQIDRLLCTARAIKRPLFDRSCREEIEKATTAVAQYARDQNSPALTAKLCKAQGIDEVVAELLSQLRDARQGERRERSLRLDAQRHPVSDAAAQTAQEG